MSDSDRDLIRELFGPDVDQEHGQHILDITDAARERRQDALLEALSRAYQANGQAKAEDDKQ
jgi:hypothetical protein